MGENEKERRGEGEGESVEEAGTLLRKSGGGLRRVGVFGARNKLKLADAVVAVDVDVVLVPAPPLAHAERVHDVDQDDLAARGQGGGQIVRLDATAQVDQDGGAGVTLNAVLPRRVEQDVRRAGIFRGGAHAAAAAAATAAAAAAAAADAAAAAAAAAAIINDRG